MRTKTGDRVGLDDDGDLTQERADEIASRLAERLPDTLDRGLPGPRGTHPGGRGQDGSGDSDGGG